MNNNTTKLKDILIQIRRIHKLSLQIEGDYMHRRYGYTELGKIMEDEMCDGCLFLLNEELK